jgi:ParB family chromosome partitioning protein
VQIETTWRSAKEQRPGALNKNQFRVLDTPDNPDAEPPCSNTKSALIVFGRGAGKAVAICTDDDCPVHDPATAARIAKQQAENPQPVMEPAQPEETEEEAQARQAEYEQRRVEYEAEQERKAAERKAEQERRQKEYEAEQKKREKEDKARRATLERIFDHAPAMFSATQLRTFLSALINLDAYVFEDVAESYIGDDENNQQSAEEILASVLASLADDKLTGFALRLVLTAHAAIPNEGQLDLLAEAEAAFAPPKPKAVKAKDKPKPVVAALSTAKKSSRKKAA